MNVISGDGIAGMEVHVPRPATIEASYWENDNISHGGRGRIVGLALVEEGKPLRRAFQLVSVRWAFCRRPARAPKDAVVLTSTSRWGGKRWRVPAGDYRLYLIADGAPVEVRLRLDGLDGRTALLPAAPVAGRIATPQTTVGTTGHLFLGRDRPMVMPAPGLLINGDTSGFSTTPHFSARGECFWRGRFDQEPVERSIPGPHCYNWAERGGLGAGGGVFGGGSSAWGMGTVPRGRWQSSYWSADASAFPKSRFLTLWLAYEDLAR